MCTDNYLLSMYESVTITPLCENCRCGQALASASADQEIEKELLIPGQIDFETCQKACIDDPGCHGLEHSNGGPQPNYCYKCYDVDHPYSSANSLPYNIFKIGTFFINNYPICVTNTFYLHHSFKY